MNGQLTFIAVDPAFQHAMQRYVPLWRSYWWEFQREVRRGMASAR